MAEGTPRKRRRSANAVSTAVNARYDLNVPCGRVRAPNTRWTAHIEIVLLNPTAKIMSIIEHFRPNPAREISSSLLTPSSLTDCDINDDPSQAIRDVQKRRRSLEERLLPWYSVSSRCWNMDQADPALSSDDFKKETVDAVTNAEPQRSIKSQRAPGLAEPLPDLRSAIPSKLEKSVTSWCIGCYLRTSRPLRINSPCPPHPVILDRARRVLEQPESRSRSAFLVKLVLVLAIGTVSYSRDVGTREIKTSPCKNRYTPQWWMDTCLGYLQWPDARAVAVAVAVGLHRAGTFSAHASAAGRVGDAATTVG
ncbi:uncharacterized protein DSM5745_06862 [Aspergillus mulundensis]|uniref:Uncharacterized protein n=1 Tax=Aspergillus mulundensis TaxID=1810919 RepID=A0A3D8RSD2_9EURO|nr:hypothetical protein DSM5745_06862 [Aspergillus mulundensis]RDW76870.1 hypothetical protein DSM5745_06862 [Aspergillus mulundensis]